MSDGPFAVEQEEAVSSKAVQSATERANEKVSSNGHSIAMEQTQNGQESAPKRNGHHKMTSIEIREAQERMGQVFDQMAGMEDLRQNNWRINGHDKSSTVVQKDSDTKKLH